MCKLSLSNPKNAATLRILRMIRLLSAALSIKMMPTLTSMLSFRYKCRGSVFIVVAAIGNNLSSRRQSYEMLSLFTPKVGKNKSLNLHLQIEALLSARCIIFCSSLHRCFRKRLSENLCVRRFSRGSFDLLA